MSVRSLLAVAAVGILTAPTLAQDKAGTAPGSNPLFRDRFTADPAPLVVGDTLYLYTGHDVAQRDEMFNMQEWLVWSTKDMRTCGHADMRTCGHADMRTCGHADMRTCGHADMRTCGHADMRTWTAHQPIMNVKDFKWARKDAWAAQTIEKNGKFWFYAAVEQTTRIRARRSRLPLPTSRPARSSTPRDRRSSPTR